MEHLYLIDGSVNPNLINKEIIIYGCGNDGKKLFHKLKKLNKNIKFFCDSDTKKVGTYIEDIEIISKEALKQHNDCAIALAFFRWTEIIKEIENMNFKNIFADYMFEQETDKKCILCGSDDCSESKSHFSGFLKERMFLNKEKETSIVHCKKCDFFFSSYRPTDDEIGRLYQQYRGEEYQKQREKYEPNYTKEYNEQIYYNKENVINRKKGLENFLANCIDYDLIKNVLDYGGDEGQFIPDKFDKAEKYVYEVSGNKVVDTVTLLSDLEKVKEKKWDFIMCCHLLEHLSEPLEIFELLVELTQDNSYLYIEVPFETKFKNYSDYEFNEHINFYSLNSLNNLGLKFNLNIVKQSQDNNVIRILYKKQIKGE